MVFGMQTLIDTSAPKRASSALAAPSRFTRDEVLTASDVANILHLPVSTVYYLARRGELPALRLGRSWRFLRSRLEDYLNG
jgi:excisionase family DNA binding protein